MTGLEWVNAACEIIGVKTPADGALSAEDSQTGLTHANLLRKALNGQRLAIPVIERNTYTWPSGQSARTIGAAGQLVGTRPEAVLIAKVIPVGSTQESPVFVLTEGEYAAISNKAQTADYFTGLRYERTAPLVGTITVWPVPTTAPTLVIHHQTQYGALEANTTLSVPESLENGLVLKLAKRLATIFRKPWTQANEDELVEAWRNVQIANIRVPDEKRMPSGFPGTARGVSQADFDAGRM